MQQVLNYNLPNAWKKCTDFIIRTKWIDSSWVKRRYGFRNSPLLQRNRTDDLLSQQWDLWQRPVEMWWHIAETRFRLSAKRTSPFKSTWASVQSTTGSRGVRISGSNAGYTMFRGSVKGTGYPLHSRVSPTLPHPCVTVCHHISTGVYLQFFLLFYFPHPLCSVAAWLTDWFPTIGGNATSLYINQREYITILLVRMSMETGILISTE